MGITTLSFSERLDSSRTILAYYIQNENDFVAYNSVRFTPSWKTNWNAAIVAAESVSTDENIVDLGTDRTATVIQVMEEARQNYQRFLKPFIEDAFEKTQPGLMNSFGINNYAEARTVVPKMLLFLKNLEEKCATHQAALSAVGINPAKVALITQQYNTLVTSSITQNTFVGERAVSTEERNRLFDTMDEFMSQTLRAGKNIYDKTDARYRRYVLYRAVAGSNTTNVVTLDIAKQSQMKAFIGLLTAQSVLDISNNSDVPLTVFITASESDNTPVNAAIIPARTANMRVFATDICPSGAYNFILVRNEDANLKAVCVLNLLKMVEDN